MLLTFASLVAGALAALATIKYYEPDGHFNRRDLLLCLFCVLTGLTLIIVGQPPETLALTVASGLLCACAITDVLRGWLPCELTLPLIVASLWHASLSPWGFPDALIWGGIWTLFYTLRYGYYYLKRADSHERPGGGDVFLVAAAGLCGGNLSGMTLAMAISAHFIWGTLRHQRIAPFGPWLSLAIGLQLFYL